ncbi:MAG TPA: helix-turn-helix domain-containing protein [Thermoanaerobaculia bacterium]|nr:helix-turn-helix domain-containing protein [Thermoanaerobaculia bacterium]
MPPKIPPLNALIAMILRESQGKSQKEVAAALGRSRTLVSALESGDHRLDRDRLEELTALLGYAPEAIDLVATLLGLLPLTRLDPAATEEERFIALAAARVATTAVEATLAAFPRALRRLRARRAPEEAKALWETFKTFSAKEQAFLLKEAPEYQTTAFCVRLCAESVKAAANLPDQALALTRLTLEVARLVSGGEGWRTRLAGYCWAYIGNALRVANDLDGAEAAFVQAWALWKAGTPEEVEMEEQRLAHEWRIYDLEASLLREQRRFDEALALLDEAFSRCGGGEAAARILLKRAFTLEQQGEYASAIAALEQAAPLVEAEKGSRLRFGLRFNLGVNFCHLHLYAQASELLPEIRVLAVGLRNELDLLRTLWLRGRVAAGEGRWEEAVLALEQVRGAFISRDLSFDAALVCLEIATLLLERGETRKVRALVQEMMPVFRSKKIHREAQTALQRFREASEKDAATLDLARGLVCYLYRARHDPRLRFEA